MKMKTLVSLVCAATLSIAAQASTVSNDSLSALNAVLKQSPGQPQAVVMPEFDAYLKSTTQTTLTPIKIDRSIYLFTDQGKTIISLSEANFVQDNGFVSGTDLLMNMMLVQSDLSIYPSHTPTTEQKAEILVFTDPTCVYCQKFDEQLNVYLDAGVRITYIPFPRGGLIKGSPGYDRWVSVACSADPAKAYHQAILGNIIPDTTTASGKNVEDCANMVDSGYNMGVEGGVRGTPYIILKREGQKNVNISGFLPAEQLLKNANL